MQVTYVAGGEYFDFVIPEWSNSAPHTLYRAFDCAGVLLYVGISGHAPARMKQHSRTAPWFTRAVRWETEEYPSWKDAARAETDAIHNERPLFNIRSSVREASNAT